MTPLDGLNPKRTASTLYGPVFRKHVESNCEKLVGSVVVGGILLLQMLQSHVRGVRKSRFGCIRGNGSLHSLRASLLSSVLASSSLLRLPSLFESTLNLQGSPHVRFRNALFGDEKLPQKFVGEAGFLKLQDSIELRTLEDAEVNQDLPHPLVSFEMLFENRKNDGGT